MSISNISPDDPKLTAYALGELEGEERAAFEAALREDPAAQAAVEEIRATVARVTSALLAEPLLESAGESTEPADAKAAIIQGRDPAKLDGGTHFGKMIRMPHWYFVVGGLAAACFAVFVAFQPAFQKVKSNRTYAAVSLAPQSADKKAVAETEKNEVAVAMPSMKDESLKADRSEFRYRQEAESRSLAVAKTQQLDLLSQSVRRAPSRVDALAGAAPAPTSFSTGSANLLAKEGRISVENKTEVGNGSLRDAFSNSNSPAAVPAAPRSSIPSTEAYAYQSENDFLGAEENPLSTFSIDVDTAGYSTMRSFIEGGRLPPPSAVRIEELVNYFPYRYATPTDQTPFAAAMEVADAPWAPTHRLVRIGLKGREVATTARPAANLVFLLDVSGSMDEPNKLPLVKESMRLLVGKLRPDDRVAIVVYAGASGLALPSTTVKHASEILAALDSLTPGGSTNGAMGIQLAYDIAKANFIPGGVNRVILCTDGDFNVGVTNEADLTQLITEKAKSGVFLTALGFGMGNYKDATLEKLADKGNGNYGYIDTRREAEKLLVEQVNGTLMTIAKDVKMQVEFNPAFVASYRLIGYENRMLKKEDFNNDAVDAGEIGAGHTVTALYEIVPAGAEEKTRSGTMAVDPLKYRIADTRLRQGYDGQAGDRKVNSSDGQIKRDPQSRELLTLKVRYKEPAGEVSRKLEFPLVDNGGSFPKATADFKFAAAVAEFGMILRESPHKGAATLADVIAMAEAGSETDAGGYRAEFIELVRKTEKLVR